MNFQCKREHKVKLYKLAKKQKVSEAEVIRGLIEEAYKNLKK